MSPLSDQDADRIAAKAGKPRPKGSLPYLPDGREPEALREWLTRALRPPEGWTVDTFERAGVERNHPCSLTIRSGRETQKFRFRHQGDLYGRNVRPVVLAITSSALDVPHLTAGEVEDLWAALCKLGKVLSETDEPGETRGWIEQLLDIATPLRGHSLVPDHRHDGLMAIKAAGKFVRRDAIALLHAGAEDLPAVRRPLRFIDQHTGEQWLRAGETATFVRWVIGAEPVAADALRARLHEIGVAAKHFQDYRPPHPSAWLYGLTPELIEHVDGVEDGGAA